MDWTDARIAAVLLALAERGRMPTYEELESEGLSGLAGTLRARGGRASWADRLGLAATEPAEEPPAEERVARDPVAWLRGHGVGVDDLNHGGTLLVRGATVAVRTSELRSERRGNRSWTFDVQRRDASLFMLCCMREGVVERVYWLPERDAPRYIVSISSGRRLRRRRTLYEGVEGLGRALRRARQLRELP